MKQLFLSIALLFVVGVVHAQLPTIDGNTKFKTIKGNESWYATMDDLTAYLGTLGGGTVTTVSVASANGFAGSVANATSTPAITISTSITGMLKGNGTAISAGTSGTDYSAGTSALATGILKSTTTTGALSIAVAGDFPTLNQNTTGSAATLTTSRSIHGGSFNGSADVTNIIASTFGGTGNGFAKLSGPTTSEKTFTLPDASTTILTTNYTGALATGIVKNTTSTGALTIAVAGDFPTLNQNTTGSAATLTTPRGIYGNNFDGSAALTQIIASTYGGTGNGFTKFSGATTSEKTYTLPDASTTIVTVASTPAVTTTAAAVALTWSGADLQLNLPNADASNRGTVSTSSQTFAGDKTFTGKTSSQGFYGTSTSTVAALDARGVVSSVYNTITGNVTLTESDNFVEVGTLTAAATISLPACNATRNGWEYRVLKVGSDIYGAIIDPNSTETFTDGASTKTLYSQNSSANCKCKWNGSVGTWFFQSL